MSRSHRYDTGIEHVKSLLADEAERAALGERGREEVMQWAWSASNANLRNNQYTRAMQRKRLREQLKNALKKVPKLQGTQTLSNPKP